MSKVVVGVSEGLGGLAALHRAVVEARLRRVELCAVLAWQAPGGGPAARASCGAPTLELCRSAAADRLRAVLDTAFGIGTAVPLTGPAGPGPAPAPAPGPGPGSFASLPALTALTVRGAVGEALVDVARDPEDLLVVGSGPRGPIRRLFRPSVARQVLAHAACPVLVVPPSPLRAAYESVHRRNTWHLPLDTRELA